MSIIEIEHAIEKLPLEEEVQVFAWLSQRIETLEARQATSKVFSIFDKEEATQCNIQNAPKSGQ